MSQTSAADVARIDPNMVPAPVEDGLVWYDVRPLGVEGRGWTETGRFFSRLPAKAQAIVREPVWNGGQRSAGLCVRFLSDSSAVSARWTVLWPSLAMDHMAATGVSGLDLYVRLGGEGGWRWLGVGRAQQFPTNQRLLAADMPPGLREYLLYLPLYNGTERLEIGVPPESSLRPAPPRSEGRRRPVCFYGTSIVQGGCASRPGMAYPAILGRRLDRPVINLGFSGNAKMEPEMANLLSELDVAAYVLDPLPNVQEPMITERLEPMVRTLRSAHPDAPIVLVESIIYQDAHLVASRRSRVMTSNAAFRSAFERLRLAGVSGLHYVPAEGLLGEDGEATVDGTHATDLGFVRMANALEPVLRAAGL